MNTLSDINGERALLAGLIKYGTMMYHETSTLGLSDATFTEQSHKIIYKCLDKIFKDNENIKPDIPLIYSAAADIGVKHFFQKDEEVQYLVSISQFPVKEKNVVVLGKKIRKLEIVRNIVQRANNTIDKYLTFTGNEPISEIFGVMEENIIDCASFLSVEDMGITLISDGIEEHFKELEANPINQVGVSTGFAVYDEAIGGGMRRGSVNIIAARPKIGKSTLSLNIGTHISKMNIPVLYLDTEMSKIDSWTRLVSSISTVQNKKVETGKYSTFTSEKNKVSTALEDIKKLPFYYTSIAGQGLEAQISMIKRWIITSVGLESDGVAKPCVIIYDYLKIMDQADIKSVAEFQAVGFLMQSLINFAKKYMIPVLAFVQMNRDGINREDTGTISLSDRILWFCSSLAIFKAKSSDEMDRDGYENGNRKLKVLDCRYGPGMAEMDYINCHFNKSISKITEGKTNLELEKERKINEAKIKIDEEEPGSSENSESSENGDGKIPF
jgi:replicative DNA helicase